MNAWQPRTEAEWDEWERGHRSPPQRKNASRLKPPNPPSVPPQRGDFAWQSGDPSSTAPRCPQYWAQFTVHGEVDIYHVMFEDVIGQKLTCTCPAFKFSGHTHCKHIDRVRSHGCFGDGPNDLPSLGITMETDHPTLESKPARPPQCCKLCGELMRVPAVRMVDDLGHQLIRVQFHNNDIGCAYAYIGAPLNIGDKVAVPNQWTKTGTLHGTVVGFGSDYAGPLVELSATLIIENWRGVPFRKLSTNTMRKQP
ncbi:SWIM zinc finger family protein [Mycobacterium sp.]|uniref:SWIM zinc finger family protein n=1 Tax=Mycobacterium sp. TaxID=1785 RepID=UPI003F9C191B